MSFDSELISSKLKGNHAQNLLDIINPKAGRLPLCSNTSSSSAALEEEDYKFLEDEIEEIDAIQISEKQDIQLEGSEILDEEDEEMEGNLPIEQPVTNMSTNSYIWTSLRTDSLTKSLHQCHAHTLSQGASEDIAMSFPSSIARTHKVSLRDGHNAFNSQRHHPYSSSQPPSSTGSMGTRRTSTLDSILSSTKLASSPGRALSTKLDELDTASDALSSTPSTSSHNALKYNYSLCKKELDLQKDELNAKWANAEAQFQHEHELKLLDIKLSEFEECSLTRCINLLNKQIEYAQAMKQLGAIPDLSVMGDSQALVAPSTSYPAIVPHPSVSAESQHGHPTVGLSISSPFWYNVPP